MSFMARGYSTEWYRKFRRCVDNHAYPCGAPFAPRIAGTRRDAMDEQHGDRPARTPTSCCAARSSTPRPSVAVAHARRRPGAGRGADRRLPRPRPTSARSRPTSPTAPRGAGSAIGADELLRVPCDLDLGDAGDPRRGRGGLRRAGPRAARRAGRRRHRAGRLARAARASSRRRQVGVDRSVDARRCACPPTGSCRSRSSRPSAHHRRAGVRRAHAGRGPPADGHRLRPAGRRPRLPAARRPRALPGGLRRARRRARPPHGRAPRAPGGLGAPLPGAPRRGLPRAA